MNALWYDLRFAVRLLAKTPGLTLVALLTLAIGIGINTSTFCVLDVALWRRLPIEGPDCVVSVMGGEQGSRYSRALSYADYADLRDRNQVFSGLLAMRFGNLAFSTSENRRGGGNERAESLFGELVSGNYFEVLQVQPEVGRMISADDDRPTDGETVAVLSHSLWKRRFNADPRIVGRVVHLNQLAYTVIGVAPATFKGIVPGVAGDYWIPIHTRLNDGDDTWAKDRAQRSNIVLGRLRQDIDMNAANANVQVIWRALVDQFPTTNQGATAEVVPEIQGWFGRDYPAVRLASTLAQLVAALVLLISCANVANLLLAKATARTKELAVRQALGASPWRVARQLMTESLLLAVMGGALGLIVALWCGDLFRATLPPTTDLVQDYDYSPGVRAFLGALGLSVLAGLIFGLAPSLRASRVSVMAALKSDAASEGQSLRRFGLRHALVVLQLGISMVVVASGALFVRSLWKIEAVDSGLRTENLVSVELDPGLLEYRGDEIRRYFVQILSRIEAIPGVRSVAAASSLPLTGVYRARPIVKEGDPPVRANEGMEATYTIVGPRYFVTVGSELVLGRDFLAEEHEGSPRTAILNQEMTRRLFGDERAAIGKRFRAGQPGSALLEVVGVAKDGKYLSLTEDPGPHFFLPEMPADSPDANSTQMRVLVRVASAGEVPRVAARMREEIQLVDPRIPLQGPLVSDEHVRGALYLPRVAAALGTVFGLLSLFLATMGVYSVMAYGVSQRTKEIGIRMALGGRAGDIVRLVMRQGAALLALGALAGALAAFFVARMAEGFLFGVGAADPWAFVSTVALLTLVALLATLVPARRATQVDPMVALRYE